MKLRICAPTVGTPPQADAGAMPRTKQMEPRDADAQPTVLPKENKKTLRKL